mmetsp:Transcript_32951/g.49753  ORF Transcript_32951/g.49753 Transcript_32951/m.49753 type:complete len:112 (+) Transcript_32951:628-963(+)
MLLMTLGKEEGTPAVSDIKKLSDRLHDCDPNLLQDMMLLKAKPKLEITSPLLDTGFEVTLVELIRDMGTSDKVVLSNLCSQWSSLCDNVDTLMELQQGTREAVRNLHRKGK